MYENFMLLVVDELVNVEWVGLKCEGYLWLNFILCYYGIYWFVWYGNMWGKYKLLFLKVYFS